MYLVNNRVINYIRYTFSIGIALLLSFVLPLLEQFRLISIAFLLIAYGLNRVYPYGISIEEDKIMIKPLLAKEYKSYSLQQIIIIQNTDKGFLQINTQGKRYYRISTERLSIRLYNQLVPYIKNN